MPTQIFLHEAERIYVNKRLAKVHEKQIKISRGAWRNGEAKLDL